MLGGPEGAPGEEDVIDRLRGEVEGGKKSASAIDADKLAAMEQGMDTSSVDEGQMTLGRVPEEESETLSDVA